MPTFGATESSFTVDEANKLISDMYASHSQVVTYLFDEFAFFGLLFRREIKALAEFEWFDYYSDALTTLCLYAPIFHDDSISENDVRAATTLMAVSTMANSASTLDFFRRNMDHVLRHPETPFTLSETNRNRVSALGKAVFFFWLSIDQLLSREDTTVFAKSAMNRALEKFKEHCLMTGTWMRELFVNKFDSNYTVTLKEHSIIVTKKSYLPDIDADDIEIRELRFGHFEHKKLHELMNLVQVDLSADLDD